MMGSGVFVLVEIGEEGGRSKEIAGRGGAISVTVAGPVASSLAGGLASLGSTEWDVDERSCLRLRCASSEFVEIKGDNFASGDFASNGRAPLASVGLVDAMASAISCRLCG